MRPALRRLLLTAVRTDAHAVLEGARWSTRCLHCRTRLTLLEDGTPEGHASLEHVVPRAWFGKRAAQALTAQVGSDANDARNLALACTRCNQGKGKGHDAAGPADARAFEVVSRLLAQRLARWREPHRPQPGDANARTSSSRR